MGRLLPRVLCLLGLVWIASGQQLSPAINQLFSIDYSNNPPSWTGALFAPNSSTLIPNVLLKAGPSLYEEIDATGATVRSINATQFRTVHTHQKISNKVISSTWLVNYWDGTALNETHVLSVGSALSFPYGPKTIVVQPNQYKISINISGWVFANPSNRLRLTYTFEVVPLDQIGSATPSTDPTTGDIVAVSIKLFQYPQMSWVFGFATEALVGSLTTLSPIHTSASISAAGIAGVWTFPSFTDFVYYDPEMSVLLSPAGGADSSPGGLSTGAVIGICAAVAVVVIVSLAVVLLWLKYRSRRKATDYLAMRPERLPNMK